MTVSTSGPDVDGFADSTAHLRAAMAWVDVLIGEELDRQAPAPDASPLFASPSEIEGLLTSPQDAARIVAGTADHDREPASSTAARLRAGLREREARSAAAGTSLRVRLLADAFELSETAADVLLVALAPEVEEKYGRIFGYLRDDLAATRPTVELVLRLLTGHGHDRATLRSALAPGAPLRRHRLVHVDPDGPGPRRTVRIDDRIAGYLLGGDDWVLDRDLAITLHEPSSVAEGAPLPPDAAESLAPIAAAVGTEAARPLLGLFYGEDERAAETAVAVVCAGTGRPRLRVDLSALVGDGPEVPLRRVCRDARVRNAVLHVAAVGDVAGADPQQFRHMLGRLDEHPGACFLTSDTSMPADAGATLEHHVVRIRRFPRPSMQDRTAYWSAVPDLPANASPAELASRYRLTSGEIGDAVAAARAFGDGTITAAGLERGCRLQSRGDLDDLAREIEPGHDWSDIVLPAATTRRLRELAAMIRNRGRIFEQWGFEERYSRGTGINVLFTGKPGTGKTMAAEVIADDVSLPLYRLDLSNVLSKYIGETEENLGRAFDAIERSDAIVFFDEADALFGKRTEVSDARDRYANAEVDYLLERMENHDGCVILATNLKENIDEAFRRRITGHVEFPLPDASARREIWADIFPAPTPTAELDLGFLADFELTGGDIKSAAVYAAGLAAEADEPVGMEHLVRAIEHQLQQAGTLYDRSIFGDYREVLE